MVSIVYVVAAALSFATCTSLALWVTVRWPISGHPLLTPFLSLLGSIIQTALLYTRFSSVLDLDATSLELCTVSLAMYYTYIATQELLFIQRSAIFHPFDNFKQALLRYSCMVFLWMVAIEIVIYSYEMIFLNDYQTIYCTNTEVGQRSIAGQISVLTASVSGSATFFGGLYCLREYLRETTTETVEKNTSHASALRILYYSVLSVTLTFSIGIFWVFRPWISLLPDLVVFLIAFIDSTASLILSLLIFSRLVQRHRKNSGVPSNRKSSNKSSVAGGGTPQTTQPKSFKTLSNSSVKPFQIVPI